MFTDQAVKNLQFWHYSFSPSLSITSTHIIIAVDGINKISQPIHSCFYIFYSRLSNSYYFLCILNVDNLVSLMFFTISPFIIKLLASFSNFIWFTLYKTFIISPINRTHNALLIMQCNHLLYPLSSILLTYRNYRYILNQPHIKPS